MAEVIDGILIREVETKNIMTKSGLPVGGYSVNPYVGCTHACKYCYASFMKRFTGHKEELGYILLIVSSLLFSFFWYSRIAPPVDCSHLSQNR